MQNPDGSLLTRLVMEQQIRETHATVQDRRLLAITPYGLESKVAYDMKPITVIHWVLDQLVRQGAIHGEQIFGIWQDELDVQYVMRLQLNRPMN